MCIFTFLNSVSMPIFYEWGQRLGHLEMIFHLSPNNKAVVKFGSLKFVREDPRLYREFIVAEPIYRKNSKPQGQFLVFREKLLRYSISVGEYYLHI